MQYINTQVQNGPTKHLNVFFLIIYVSVAFITSIVVVFCLNLSLPNHTICFQLLITFPSQLQCWYPGILCVYLYLNFTLYSS